MFDAFSTLADIREAYAGFLTDRLHVDASKPFGSRLEQLWSSLEAGGVAGEPLVEVAWGYPHGANLDDLLPKEGRPDRTLTAASGALWRGERDTFFKHQIDAIKAGVQGNTVVLAAGTGSGKTESFLVPILDRLFRSHAANQDDLRKPGVRAIIVYPLNALVEDQLGRIDRILRPAKTRFASMNIDIPAITFAHYTGRTKNQDSGGTQDAAYPRLTDRLSIRNNPPHILITNYVMLQYMLLRPKDAGLFTPECLFHRPNDATNKLPRLRSIVLDEAHAYAGSQGAEIHLLLRRACERFGTTLEAVQGFATSATIGDGTGDALQEYAARMFAKPFGKVAAISAEQEGPAYAPDDAAERVYCVPPAAPSDEDWSSILRNIDTPPPHQDSRNSALSALTALGIVAAEGGNDAPTPVAALHDLLATSTAIRHLVTTLWARRGERVFQRGTIADLLLPPEAGDRAAHALWAERLLQLLARARALGADRPLLPTRIHAMLRAPTGVFLPLEDGPPGTTWIDQLTTARSFDEAGRLEVWRCTTCGAPALGRISEQGQVDESAGWFVPMADGGAPAFGAPATALHGTNVEWVGPAPKPDATDDDLDDDAEQEQVVQRCPACRTVEARFSRLIQPPELAMGPVVDALYRRLPHRDPSNDGRPYPGSGRSLVAMYDNRQTAARAASTLESSHERIWARQRMFNILGRAGPNGLRSDEIVGKMQGLMKESSRLSDHWRSSAQEVDAACGKAAWATVYDEFVISAGRGGSLEAIGITILEYELPPRPAAVPLNDEAWKAFASEVLDELRRAGEVTDPPTGTNDNYPHYRRNRGIILYAPAVAARGRRRRALLTGGTGRLRAFANAVGCAAGENGEAMLTWWWNAMVGHGLDELGAPLPPARCVSVTNREGAETLQVRWDVLRVVQRSPEWYDAQTQQPLARVVQVGEQQFSVRRGGAIHAEPTSPELLARLRQRYALKRVNVLPQDPSMWAVENTAATGANANQDSLQRFKDGSLNLMCCSTTLEMGVDVGGLQSVVLGNVPPGPANYWQRAGRAGRRGEGSTLVLTMALDRLHDQAVFADPLRLLGAPISAPSVVLDGRSLLERHFRAWLLQRFLMVPGLLAGDPTFNDVKQAVFEPLPPAVVRQTGLSGAYSFMDALCVWVGLHSKDLIEGVTTFTSSSTLAAIRPADLLNDAAEAFKAVVQAIRSEHGQLTLERDDAENEERTTTAAAISHQLDELLGEVLVSRLVRDGLLPRFGFPTDIVQLTTKYKPTHGARSYSKLHVPSPERDLRVALGEYAPGAQLVIAKKLYTVAGLAPDFAGGGAATRARVRVWRECPMCHTIDTGRTLPAACTGCGEDWSEVEPTEDGAETLDREFARWQADLSRMNKEDKQISRADRPHPRPYLEPTGFRVQWGVAPPEFRNVSRVERMPQVTMSVSSSGERELDTWLPDLLTAAFIPRTTVLLRQEGRGLRLDDGSRSDGYGFAICQRCGRALPEKEPQVKQGHGTYTLTPTPGGLDAAHTALRGGNCPGGAVWRNRVLGTTQYVDALRVRLTGDLSLQDGAVAGISGATLALTLASILVPVLAADLQVDPRVFTPLSAPAPGAGKAYDALVTEGDGAGLLERVADRVPEMLERALLHLQAARGLADLAQFHNMYGLEQGTVRPDALQDFLSSPTRKDAWRTAYDQWSGVQKAAPGLPMHGVPWSAVVAEVLTERSGALIVASWIGERFGDGTILRLVERAAITGQRPRLLLAVAPTNTLRQRLALAPLASLQNEDAVEVRIMVGGETELRTFPWRLSGSRLQRLTVIGVRTPGGSGLPYNDDHLGRDAAKGSVVVRASHDDNDPRDTLQRLWEEAQPLVLLEGAQGGLIRFEGTMPRPTVLRSILEEKLGFPIPSLQKLVYEDIYVAHRTTSFRAFLNLIKEFALSSGAKVCVDTGIYTGKIRSCRDADAVEAASPRDSEITRVEAEEWLPRKISKLSTELKVDISLRRIAPDGAVTSDAWRAGGNGVVDRVKRDPMAHERKLDLCFEDGRTLTVLLDKGLASFIDTPAGWVAEESWLAYELKVPGR